MRKEKIWDLYFSELHKLLFSKKTKIEDLIKKEVRSEIAKRWKDVNKEGIKAYIEAAISFIEERLYAYRLDHMDRFLKAVSHDSSLKDLASIDLSLSWYDWREEKKQIDAKIETGLNIKQTPEDIVNDLIGEFGAFPDRSIIKRYLQKPKKNYLPDYVLAMAIQEVIRLRC
jgi:hypothetical protein